MMSFRKGKVKLSRLNERFLIHRHKASVTIRNRLLRTHLTNNHLTMVNNHSSSGRIKISEEIIK